MQQSIRLSLRDPVQAKHCATSLLKGYGMRNSMNCWYNTCSETLSGSIKIERRLHGMQFGTRHRVEDEIVDWLL